jgi:hypothetical protein
MLENCFHRGDDFEQLELPPNEASFGTSFTAVKCFTLMLPVSSFVS